MRAELFQHEVTQTSALFGRKADVRVVFEGSDAKTNGTTIYLPALTLGVDINTDDQAVMRGYVDHEAGHVRHSDMPLILRKYGEYEASGRKLARVLHNCLEDVWLERRVMAEYPGAERNLHATARAVNGQALEAFTKDEAARKGLSEPTYIVPFALTWLGRRDYGGPECQALLDMLPENVSRWLDEPIAALDDCRTTGDVFDVAEELERQLKEDFTKRTGKAREEAKPEGTPDKAKPMPVMGSKGEGEEGETPGDGDPVDLPEASGEGEGGEAPEGEAESGAPATSTKRDAGGAMGEAGDAKPAELLEPEDVYDDTEIGDVVERLTSDVRPMEGSDERRPYRPYTTRHDRWLMPDGGDFWSSKMRSGTAEAYDSILAGMSGPVNQMRRSLERALLAKQTRDWDFGKERGRLDARRFPAVMAGRTTVFKERMDRAEIDTAVSIVVDLSGSMTGMGKDHKARDCVIALAEAIDRTGVAYEITGFSCPMTLPDHPMGKWSRFEPLVGWQFKPFERRLQMCKGPIASIPRCVGGNNADGEAVMMAYARLRQRREQRKVLMVLSDGHPEAESSYGRAHLGAHLRSVVRTIEAEGTQVMGIGLVHHGVGQFYPNHVVVNDVNELGKACVGQLGRMLLGDSRGVDRSGLVAGL